VFSAFAPYQQHVASSFFRLVAQVTPVLVLWLACRGNEPQSIGLRPVFQADELRRTTG
jgi:hypothetical protein